MAGSLLEKGQIVTGRFGRRYMIRSLIQDNGRFQVYEASETGKICWAIAFVKGTARFKAEFVDTIAERNLRAKEFACPIDSFNFEIAHKKLFGYIVEAENGYKPLENTSKLTIEERNKVAFGITKAFSKMHLNGVGYSELPAVWSDSNFNIKLIAVPIAYGGKFTKDDVLGIPGINAPELFAVAAVKSVTVETDRFLLAALLFMMYIGEKPFAASTDLNYAYAKFIFSGEKPEALLEKYGHATIQRWASVKPEMRNMFVKTFKEGVTDASIRYDADDWAYYMTN